MSDTSSLPSYQKNELAIFLGQLREYLGLSQDKIATHFYLDRGRISRYETDQVRNKPKIGYLAGLACLIADRQNHDDDVQRFLFQQVNEAIRHHYSPRRLRSWAELSQEADAYIAKQRDRFEKKTHRDWQSRLEKHLDLPPITELIGIEPYLDTLREVIISPKAPWLVCITGPGGLGKTALASAFIRLALLGNRFHHVAWASAKQQNFSPATGLEQVSGPALTTDTLTDILLEQLDRSNFLTLPPPQKQAALVELLKKDAYLIVIDNLETVEDYQVLLPALLKLANPTKFLLTSRYSLNTHPQIYSLTLEELTETDTIHLIRHDAKERGLVSVAKASESHLRPIYELVGGNPLALKLVVGQMSILSLREVIENLKQAGDKTVEDLYTFIYWQAWHLLDKTSRQVFLMMPLAHDGTTDQLKRLTKLEVRDLNQTLQQLARLSLIQIKGDLLDRRYLLHRLTETFLLNEAVRWKTSA